MIYYDHFCGIGVIHMLKFRQFISETKMSSTLGGHLGTRHVKKYVAPFLSKASLEKTKANFPGVNPLSKLDTSKDGEKHDPKAESTHVLQTKHGTHEAGTKIKITHVSHANGVISAHTEKHGIIPLSRIAKTESLKTPRRGEEGFDVEKKVAENLGTKNAGSSSTGYDFELPHPKHESAVRGKIKIVGKRKTPALNVRGESKLTKGRFGTTSARHNPKTNSWELVGHPKMHPVFAQTTIRGKDGIHRKLIDHLNHFHSDGKFEHGTSTPALPGTAEHYLKSGSINVLHVHNKDTKNSTTFTTGRTTLRGKTGLSHASRQDVRELDGTVNLEPYGPGSVRIAHTPKISKMKELAERSNKDPANHKTLENEKHSAEFKAKHQSL